MRRRRRGGGCIRRRSGVMISAPHSSSGSRSAGSASGGESEHLPQTLTTSRITRATGRCLPTEAICKACAIPATAARLRRNCTQKQTRCEAAINGDLAGRLGARAPALAPAAIPRTHPPAEKVSGRGREYRKPPPRKIFSPRGVWAAAVGRMCPNGTPAYHPAFGLAS